MTVEKLEDIKARFNALSQDNIPVSVVICNTTSIDLTDIKFLLETIETLMQKKKGKK